MDLRNEKRAEESQSDNNKSLNGSKKPKKIQRSTKTSLSRECKIAKPNRVNLKKKAKEDSGYLSHSPNNEISNDASSSSGRQTRTRVKPVMYWLNQSRISYKYLPNGCREIQKLDKPAAKKLFEDDPRADTKNCADVTLDGIEELAWDSLEDTNVVVVTELADTNVVVTESPSMDKSLDETKELAESTTPFSEFFGKHESELNFQCLSPLIHAAVKFQNESTTVTSVIMKPGGKNISSCCKRNMIFFVTEGSVLVKIGKTKKDCKENDICHISFGLSYSIENNTEQEAKFYSIIY